MTHAIASEVLTTYLEPSELGQAMDQTPKWLGQTVFVNGRGLPSGDGTAKLGAGIYAQQCLSCHGEGGRGGSGGQLTGNILPKEVWTRSDRPNKNIGQYWPYATTLFDYIRRAMPYQAPGSLSSEEVYSLTAYLLAEQKLIADDLILNQKTLPLVQMPNRDGFLINPSIAVKK